MLKNTLLFVVFSTLVTGLLAQNLYFPPRNSDNWDTLTPQELNYCKQELDDLYYYLDSVDSKAFILLIDGKIVIEQYFGNFTKDSFWYWASAGKTLTSSLIGIAQEQNLLKLNDVSSKYLGTGWTSLTKTQEDSIQIWNQLTMTTGLDDANNADCTDPNCLKYKAAVGTRWAYHNAPYTLLDKVIEVSSKLTLNQFLLNNITPNTGIKAVYIQNGFNKVAFSTPRNFAKFGLLLLGNGRWDQDQIIPSNYFNAMVNSSQNLNASYGYLTWLNGKENFMVPQSQLKFSGSPIKNAPDDCVMALGKNGQMIHVSPSKNMVWIRMGNAPEGASPLVNFDLGEGIWHYVNRLDCNQIKQDDLNKLEFKYYPNPLQFPYKLTLDNLDKDCKVEIWNTTSKVGIKILDETNSIELSAYSPGFYFIKIENAIFPIVLE